MQRIIDAEKSDLFDVLAHIAYALPPLTREERAARARAASATVLSSKRQAFVEFVLGQYVRVGVEELAVQKLRDLLKLRYQSVSDAKLDLGQPEEIRDLFIGFQKYLYRPTA